MSWRPTRRAWIELGGAVVLGVAAVGVVVGGVRAYLHARAVGEAAHAYYRTAAAGEPGGLEIVNQGLDRFAGEPALLAIKGAILAAREGELERAAPVFAELKKVEGEDAQGRPRAAWGRLGLGVVMLELGRRPGAGPDFRANAEREISGARKDLGARRAEPHALMGALHVDRGEVEKALESLEAAERAADAEAPTAGALLTTHAAKAEAYRRRGDWARAVSHLERAALLAPGRADLRDRLARAIARRTADPKLAGEEAKAAIAAARRVTLPVHALEKHRKAPLYGLEPEHVTLIRGAIAIAEARGGSLEAAQRTLADALREAGGPRELFLLRNLGVVYARLCRAEKNEGLRRGHARLAAEAFRDAADAPGTAPKDAFEMLLAAAIFSRQIEQYEQAVRLLDRAAKHAPEDVRLHRAYAVSYDAWNRPKQAIDAYKRAIAKAPAEAVSLEMEERMKLLEARKR